MFNRRNPKLGTRAKHRPIVPVMAVMPTVSAPAESAAVEAEIVEEQVEVVVNSADERRMSKHDKKKSNRNNKENQSVLTEFPLVENKEEV